MKIKEKKILKSGLHVLLWKEGKWFVTRCLEIEVASQGKTKKEALKNIEEAVSLFLEDEKLPTPQALPMLELHTLSLKVSYG